MGREKNCKKMNEYLIVQFEKRFLRLFGHKRGRTHTPPFPPSFSYLDVVRRRIVQQILSSLELLNELLLPPGGERLNGGIQCKGTQLEADLVIPLPGGTVRQPLSALFLRDLDLALGDDGAGEGGAEEVAAFVLGVGLLEGRRGGRS